MVTMESRNSLAQHPFVYSAYLQPPPYLSSSNALLHLLLPFLPHLTSKLTTSKQNPAQAQAQAKTQGYRAATLKGSLFSISHIPRPCLPFP
jgi:hypothetical protein